ncbi:MAG: hypothetical protein K5771_01865 [Oscillospiraceae bacterium]|nr:hypothetical protein [Oscillospiraceae bacterium]
MKRISYKNDRAKFWLAVTAVSALIWALGGLLGALIKNEQASPVFAVISGSASCCILAGAVLTLAERRGRKAPGRKQLMIEIELEALMLALVILAEVIAVSTGNVSFGPLAVIGMLCIIFCIWIAGPKLSEHIKFDTPSILLILLLGIAGSWMIAKFVSVVVEQFS